MIPRGALLDLVKGITNKTVTIWSGEPEPYLAVKNGKGGRWFELEISSYGAKGVDEYRQDLNVAADALASTLNGVRRFTLSIKAKSFDAGTMPYDMLETVRLRLRSKSAKTILQAEGLALIDFPGQIVRLGWITDTREGYAAVMDVRFANASTDDAGDDGGDYVVTAPVTGTAT